MHLKKLKNKKGQSTVEYILLVTAVIAVIIVFVNGQQKGSFQQTLNSTLNQATEDMDTMSGTLVSSHTLSTVGSTATSVINVPLQ